MMFWRSNFVSDLAMRAIFNINMICKYNFVDNCFVIKQYFLPLVANLCERMSDFVGSNI